VSHHRIKMFLLFITCLITVGYAITGNELWEEYKANPDNHSHIPNCSYAGYMFGDVPIPNIPVVVDIRDFGGVGDGNTDNSHAFRLAIDAAFARGGGAIFIPEGTWVVDNLIRVHRNNIVLKGAGRDKTTIKFTRTLEEVAGSTGHGSSKWNWSGGLLWFGPDDQFHIEDSSYYNAYLNAPRDYVNKSGQRWEYWQHGEILAQVISEHARGDRTLTVDNAELLRADMKILLAWTNNGDTAFAKAIGEHELMLNYKNYGEYTTDPDRMPFVPWAVEIASVSGNQVVLKQPLRVKITAADAAAIRHPGPIVQHSGVEHLTLELNARLTMENNSSAGWNGVSFNRAWHCFARDVAVKNGENGFLISCSKNVSIINTAVIGDRMVHHAYTNRAYSQDILYQNFTIDLTGKIMKGMHGINTEWFSAGNVWSEGTMNQGTFDSHRAMPWDYIRSDIFVNNNVEANPGGAREAGPYTGRRTVHWNIRIGENTYPENDKAIHIFQPDNHVLGALVGIQNAPVCTTACWNNPNLVMPWGDKDVVIADSNSVPEPENIYNAQLVLKQQQKPTLAIISPFSGYMINSGDTLTITAAVSGIDNAQASIHLYKNGNRHIASATAQNNRAVFETVVDSAASYHVTTQSGEGQLQSKSVIVSCAAPVIIDDKDPLIAYTGEVKNYTNHKEYTFEGTSRFFIGNGSITYTFDGVRADFYAFGKPTHITGVHFDVYIDDMTTPVEKMIRQSYRCQNDVINDYLLYSTGPLTPGTHTVKIDIASWDADLKFDFIKIYPSRGGTITPVRNNTIPVTTLSPRLTQTAGAFTIQAHTEDVSYQVFSIAGRQIRSGICPAFEKRIVFPPRATGEIGAGVAVIQLLTPTQILVKTFRYMQ